MIDIGSLIGFLAGLPVGWLLGRMSNTCCLALEIAEKARVAAERNRVQAEMGREQAEAGRVEAEEKREANADD